jgi:sigma-E factor negative regulatory protein RseC
MQSEGFVKEIISEKLAKVCMHAKGECEKCETKESCLGASEKKIKETIAINIAEAEIGDTVLLEANPWRVVLSAFLVYIFPLIILIIGYFAGNAIFKSETAGIILGISGLMISFLILKFTNKYFEKDDRYKPVIIKVIEKGNE